MLVIKDVVREDGSLTGTDHPVIILSPLAVTRISLFKSLKHLCFTQLNLNLGDQKDPKLR